MKKGMIHISIRAPTAMHLLWQTSVRLSIVY